MAIGPHLREARMAAGVSIEQLAELTRIRPSAIAAMEEGDFSSCGGDSYARMQIRSIAAALGVGPDPLLADFDHERGVSPAPRPQREIPVARPRPRRRSSSELADLGGVDRVLLKRRRSSWLVIMVVALVLIIALFVVVNSAWGGDTSRPTARSVPSLDAATGSVQISGSTSDLLERSDLRANRSSDRAAPSVAPSSAPVTEVQVSAARGRSWLWVTGSDGRVLFDGLLDSGQSQTFTGERVRVVLGNAGAIDVSVDGGAAAPAGESATVATLTFPVAAGDAAAR